MLNSHEPYKSLLKVLKFFGFLRSELSMQKKCLSGLCFVVFGIGYWILLAMSVVQYEDSADFIDRFCLAISTIFDCTETVIYFFAAKQALDLLVSIEKVLEKYSWEKAFQTAKKKSLRLVVFHSITIIVVVLASASYSIHKDCFMHDVYHFDFMHQREFFTITWIFYACGSLYTHIICLALDLLPLIVLIFLPELFQAVIDEFQSIRLAMIGVEVQIYEWTEMHQAVIALVALTELREL